MFFIFFVVVFAFCFVFCLTAILIGMRKNFIHTSCGFDFIFLVSTYNCFLHIPGSHLTSDFLVIFATFLNLILVVELIS